MLAVTTKRRQAACEMVMTLHHSSLPPQRRLSTTEPALLPIRQSLAAARPGCWVRHCLAHHPAAAVGALAAPLPGQTACLSLMGRPQVCHLQAAVPPHQLLAGILTSTELRPAGWKKGFGWLKDRGSQAVNSVKQQDWAGDQKALSQ